ncbi:conserved hypothetical protein [Mesorhizobium prunaredense]|uniref:Uncharacterized protein n=1 Tax=Mesorhizobium prunaredense TaxID=1631249 RepID=A0A1R3VEF4_9HYPH|nr:hypothetical protein [Mesorhizobium prunaredense]SIT57202.1 conserved hypothetical protein [Mesorhizobium prunaredense]
MAADPNKLTDAKQVRQLMLNAERRKATELAAACRRRLYELSGVDIADPVERRLAEAVAALEETYREKHGRAQAAGYTRRKIAKDGAVATLSDWALKSDVTPGFVALVEGGMAEFTGVIAEFPDRFEPRVVDAARKRLTEHGVKLP